MGLPKLNIIQYSKVAYDLAQLLEDHMLSSVLEKNVSCMLPNYRASKPGKNKCLIRLTFSSAWPAYSVHNYAQSFRADFSDSICMQLTK